MSRRALALLPAVALACGDAAGGTGGTEAPASSSGVDPTVTPTTTGDATTGDVPTTGATDTGGPPPPTFCAQLDVSLVIDPLSTVMLPAGRAALVEHLDDLVEETGAKVRVLPTVASELPQQTDCGDPILVWGEAGQVDPAAPAALQCRLDAIKSYDYVFDSGDSMFSGLMFPILDRADWPAAGASGLALLFARKDDMQKNMYAQPGQAAEAYLRLVGDGDRRRVAALTHGDGADELQMFALSLGETSRHFERTTTPADVALATFTPLAIQTCEDFDLVPPPPEQEPSGCKRIDVLFVIDGSGSMLEEQQALRGTNGQPPVFAEFTDALLAELTDVEDFRVGVVSSTYGKTALHTHRDQPAVAESPATDCGLPPGQRWLVGPSPTLTAEFECLAATRSATEEVTYLNAAEALHDPANAGFLRDDSLVFVVLLTDEDTYDHIYTTMHEIRAELLAAVGDDLSRLVVLAIAGGQGVFEMPETTCQGVYGEAVPGRRIISITRSFRERGLFQNICEGDLAKTFTAALGDVVSACEAFEPVP